METEPPVLATPPAAPAKPATFKLPLLAWVLWGASAVVGVGFFLLRRTPATPFAIGELMGMIVGMLVFPSIVALVCWHLSRRSQGAAAAGFYVTFGLLVLGQVSQFATRALVNADAEKEMKKIREEQQAVRAEQRAALAKGDELDETKSMALVERSRAQFGKMAENTSGRQRVMAQAGQAYLADLLAAKQRYDEAVANLQLETFWELKEIGPGDGAAVRRRNIRAFAQANAELTALQSADGKGFMRTLQQHALSETEIRDAIAGYREKAGSRLAAMARVREGDAQLAQVMLEFVDFGESVHGHWQAEAATGNILFADDAALARYQKIMERVNAIAADQAEAQKVLFAAEAKP